jgi:hypothetical protein
VLQQLCGSGTALCAVGAKGTVAAKGEGDADKAEGASGTLYFTHHILVHDNIAQTRTGVYFEAGQDERLHQAGNFGIKVVLGNKNVRRPPKAQVLNVLQVTLEGSPSNTEDGTHSDTTQIVTLLLG